MHNSFLFINITLQKRSSTISAKIFFTPYAVENEKKIS